MHKKSLVSIAVQTDLAYLYNERIDKKSKEKKKGLDMLWCGYEVSPQKVFVLKALPQVVAVLRGN
jgi:hypothetical protein